MKSIGALLLLLVAFAAAAGACLCLLWSPQGSELNQQDIMDSTCPAQETRQDVSHLD